MGSAFRSIAALIEVDFPYRKPYSEVLRQPSAHQPEDSRVVFHETVHYWQQLAQGFMALMAEEDWQRLQRFEKTKVLDPPGPYRVEFVRQHDSGFSAYDLQESLARYWDVHVIGPATLLEMDFVDPKRDIDEFFKQQYFAFKKKGMIVHPQHGGYSDLAFKMAMEASAGNYAKPYGYVRDRFNPIVTDVVFPLAGHFALQTRKPIDVFLKAVTAVAPHFEGTAPRDSSIHDLWKAAYGLVRNTTLSVARELDIGDLVFTAAVIHRGPLQEHPIYAWILGELEQCRLLLGDTSFAADFTRSFGELSNDVRGVLTLDFVLACPGDTTNRSFLIDWLAPPCVRFPDSQTWLLTELYRRELVPEIDDAERVRSQERMQLAHQCMDVYERWQEFRRAKNGY